jgi:enamine deaminase RidA (YjgF/YER057c/UK114 family)
MTMPETVAAQTRNCPATIAKALKDGGFEMADVVQTHYYVTDQAFVDAVSDPRRDVQRHPAGGNDRLPAELTGDEDRDRSDSPAAHSLSP